MSSIKHIVQLFGLTLLMLCSKADAADYIMTPSSMHKIFLEGPSVLNTIDYYTNLMALNQSDAGLDLIILRSDVTSATSEGNRTLKFIQGSFALNLKGLFYIQHAVILKEDQPTTSKFTDEWQYDNRVLGYAYNSTNFSFALGTISLDEPLTQTNSDGVEVFAKDATTFNIAKSSRNNFLTVKLFGIESGKNYNTDLKKSVQDYLSYHYRGNVFEFTPKVNYYEIKDRYESSMHFIWHGSNYYSPYNFDLSSKTELFIKMNHYKDENNERHNELRLIQLSIMKKYFYLNISKFNDSTFSEVPIEKVGFKAGAKLAYKKSFRLGVGLSYNYAETLEQNGITDELFIEYTARVMF